MKTDDEINAEIEALRKLKPTIGVRNLFGDNHHDAIEGQIEVLESRLTEEQVCDKHDHATEDEIFYPDNVFTAALQTALWMSGESEATPCSHWQGLEG